MSKHAIRFLNSARQAEKLAEACGLSSVSLERQMRTAHRLLERIFFAPGSRSQGMLLADEVGLGKTTVGALVALLAASEGNGRRVRILVPNPTIRQRWEQELEKIALGLQRVQPSLRTHPSQIRAAPLRFHPRHIHVTTHTRALKANQVSGDLIIVDEAHRSRDAESDFRENIASAARTTSRLLFLTATPMSTRPSEMAALLDVLGGEEAGEATRVLGEQIVRLYDPADQRTEQECCADLERAVRQALDLLPRYIVRHTVDGLQKREHKAFGQGRKEWRIEVPDASAAELELLARADRILRLADRGTRTNDPQHHVSRSVLRHALENARAALARKGLTEAAAPHYAAIERSGLLDTVHPKMQAVSAAIKEKVAVREKVVVFCRHHFVAAELARVLHDALPVPPASTVDPAVWREALQQLIQYRPPSGGKVLSPSQRRNAGLMREHFIDWFCAPSFRNQIGSWLPPTQPDTAKSLVAALRRTKAPRSHLRHSVAEAMQHLFDEVTAPTALSTRMIFQRLHRKMARGEVTLDSLPFGAAGATSRVLGACKTRSDEEREAWGHVFVKEARPELVMALFNSPFGPDVLVVTDRYSEGIDLHKSCRLLVHYELDPSVMRTIQRDGRVRRVGGLAGTTGQTVEYAMPAFEGTRDERLVRIMHDRINNFSLLLGAVRDLDEDDVNDDVDDRANRILARSRKTLEALSHAMTCRVPGRKG